MRFSARLLEFAAALAAAACSASLLMLAPGALGASGHDVFFVAHHRHESVTAAVKRSGGKFVVGISLQCQHDGLPTAEDLSGVKVRRSGRFSGSGTATYEAGFAKRKHTSFKLAGSLKPWSRGIKLGSLKSVFVTVKPTVGCHSFTGKLSKEGLPPAS